MARAENPLSCYDCSCIVGMLEVLNITTAISLPSYPSPH
nr:MAG TPA: hypothetical protein [Caudoviricetes sp.]